MAWLAEIPQAVVTAHLEMMRRLQCEEAMAAAAQAAAGRLLKPGPIRSQLSVWKRGAAGRSRVAAPADLTAIGIRTVRRG